MNGWKNIFWIWNTFIRFCIFLMCRKYKLPASKQYIDLFGRVQPSSGISNFSGNRSLRPYSEKTGFIRNNPP